MIEQLLEISRLGRFVENGPKICFEPMTLIQGLNGSGKTTLAAIFRSLALNDPRYLLERRSLGSTGSPYIRLQIDAELYTFSDGHWDKAYPQIAVFDSTFINENVHSGFSVSPEHRRNLFHFILGEQPVRIARKMDELDAEIRELNKQLKDFDKRPYLRGMMSMEIFSQLKCKPDLESRRQRLMHRLTAIEQREPLIDAPLLQVIRPPDFDLEALTGLLSQGFEQIQANAQQQVQAWLAALGPGGERWLAAGMTHLHGLQDSQCPFCAQALNQAELVKAYSTYFNQAYQAHQQALERMQDALTSWLPDALLLSWQHQHRSNGQAQVHWSRYTQLPEPPLLDFDAIWPQLRFFQHELSELLARKLARPMDALALPDDLWQSQTELLEPLKDYARQVKGINHAITQFRQSFREEDPEPLRRQLARLELEYQRQQPDVQADVAAMQAMRRLKEQVAAHKAELKQQLQEETTAVFSRLMTCLNKYLFRFGTGLRLSALKETHLGGKPNLEYAFRHSRGEVSLSRPKQPAPHWSTVLSEGDKQALGLAFFLAQQEERAAKVLVLDDPGVGLDRIRLETLRKWLAGARGQERQVILLTHQETWAEQVNCEPVSL